MPFLTSRRDAEGNTSMGIKATLDTLDGLDEGLKGLYTQAEDGKYKLQVEGLDDAGQLKTALQKEREAARDAQRKLTEIQKQFEGIDPVAAKDLLSKLNQSEEAKLIAEGKLDEVIRSRTERMKAEFEGKLQAAMEGKTAAEQRAARRDAQVLENQIRQAAAEAGIHKHAYEDVLLRAKTTFSLSEKDDAVAIGADGQPVYGKDGSTPLTPKEWLESLKATAPHLFPATASGGGAGSGTGTANGSFNRAKMTPAEKAAYISKHGQEAYLKLPM